MGFCPNEGGGTQSNEQTNGELCDKLLSHHFDLKKRNNLILYEGPQTYSVPRWSGEDLGGTQIYFRTRPSSSSSSSAGYIMMMMLIKNWPFPPIRSSSVSVCQLSQPHSSPLIKTIFENKSSSSLSLSLLIKTILHHHHHHHLVQHHL